MLERALELREPIDSMTILESELTPHKLSPDEWSNIRVMLRFLRVFKVASNHHVSESHPTISATLPVYNYMLDKLEDFLETNSNVQLMTDAANSSMEKLKAYYSHTC